MSKADKALPPPAGLAGGVSPGQSHVRLDVLDGIRGLAILLVILHHLAGSLDWEFGYRNPFLEIWWLGWCGVDLFFVLSGFLITGILHDSRSSPQYFRNFYARRALRIFPLYYGVLLFVVLLRALRPEAGIYGDASPLWMWTYLTNVAIAWKGFDALGFTDHLWSLAIEEHFYLLWPVLVLLIERRNLMTVAAVACALALGLRIVAVRYDAGLAAAYVLTPMRLDALAAGGLLALAIRGPGGLGRLFRPVTIGGAVAAVALVVLAVARRTTGHDDPFMQTIGFSLVAAVCASLITLGLGWGPLTRGLSIAPLRWLGKYSYGMYVWHPIVFILLLHTDTARRLRGGSDLPHAIGAVTVAVSVMLAISLMSWHCWEKHFLKLKRHFE